jgi:hypothetical protein
MKTYVTYAHKLGNNHTCPCVLSLANIYELFIIQLHYITSQVLERCGDGGSAICWYTQRSSFCSFNAFHCCNLEPWVVPWNLMMLAAESGMPGGGSWTHTIYKVKHKLIINRNLQHQITISEWAGWWSNRAPDLYSGRLQLKWTLAILTDVIRGFHQPLKTNERIIICMYNYRLRCNLIFMCTWILIYGTTCFGLTPSSGTLSLGQNRCTVLLSLLALSVVLC